MGVKKIAVSDFLISDLVNFPCFCSPFDIDVHLLVSIFICWNIPIRNPYFVNNSVIARRSLRPNSLNLFLMTVTSIEVR